jgi:hypothetical protein
MVPVPADSEYGAFRGIRCGRGNRCVRRKPTPLPLPFPPPRILYDLNCHRTRAAAEAIWELSAWMWSDQEEGGWGKCKYDYIMTNLTICSILTEIKRRNWVCGARSVRNGKIRPNPSLWTQMEDVRFEVFTALTMKNGVFWDVTACGSCKNRRFKGTYRLLHQGDKNRWTSNSDSSN